MVSYRYTAHDPEGRRVDGHVDAETIEEARRRLEQEGFEVLEVMETDASSLDAAPDDIPDALPDDPHDAVPDEPSHAAPDKRLSREDAQELAENVAQLSSAALPLSPGLRAAGDESDSPALAQALYHLADQLDRGQPLEDVLEASKDFLPAYVSGLIGAATRTSQVGPALTELMEHYRDTSAIRRGIWSGLAYPLVVAVMSALLLICIVAFLVGGFERIFLDFQTDLPKMTVMLIELRHEGPWLLPLFLIALVAIPALLRWRLGAAGWRRWVNSIPVVGPLWHWLGLLEWIGLLRVLTRYDVTLLEALRLSADGVSDSNVGRLSRALAEGIARGRSLSQTIASQRQIPASLTPLVRWGEDAGSLTESLAMGREMLEERVRMRSLWLRTALPPVLFILIGCCVLFVVGALIMPLIQLISQLT